MSTVTSLQDKEVKEGGKKEEDEVNKEKVKKMMKTKKEKAHVKF